ncbi:MAG: hypothetical protein Q4A76_03975, partial [Porphyromonadaceae bacterium]|nr:hypothetical protein [Porphyromonadaceae bacterium]
DYQKKGKQLFLFRVTRAPKGTVIGYPPMDQADFYRFENIQGEDMEAVKAYDPGGGAPHTKPNVYKIDNNLPPVRQSFTKMDKNTEKMISPKFVLASMYTPSYAMRFYSGFKPDGTLARPMDREDFYHDEYRGGYVKVWDNADVRPTIRYDMKHDDYKKNTIYKDPKVKYAYVNTHLLSANILTRLSQYWETKACNYNWKMYKEGEYENPYGAAPQPLIGLDAINVCAQYYEDVQLPNGKTKRIRNWRLPTKAELELIGSIQRNQYNVKAAGDADRMKLFKDNNIATILLDRSYFHNNGYMIFDPEILQGQKQYWSISDWGLSYTFAYPNMLQYQSWLGYYVFFVKCVHDVNRYEDESK